jgi:Fe-S cluster biosynthesis and repair protein YggX
MGEEIVAAVCRDCWNEWRENEVRVINELRLNFLDPAAQATLDRRRREFLRLPAVAPY